MDNPHKEQLKLELVSISKEIRKRTDYRAEIMHVMHDSRRPMCGLALVHSNKILSIGVDLRRPAPYMLCPLDMDRAPHTTTVRSTFYSTREFLVAGVLQMLNLPESVGSGMEELSHVCEDPWCDEVLHEIYPRISQDDLKAQLRHFIRTLSKHAPTAVVTHVTAGDDEGTPSESSLHIFVSAGQRHAVVSLFEDLGFTWSPQSEEDNPVANDDDPLAGKYDHMWPDMKMLLDNFIPIIQDTSKSFGVPYDSRECGDPECDRCPYIKKYSDDMIKSAMAPVN